MITEPQDPVPVSGVSTDFKEQALGITLKYTLWEISNYSLTCYNDTS